MNIKKEPKSTTGRLSKLSLDLLAKVKSDYSKIAEEFDETRNKPWPEFDIFLKMTLGANNQPSNKKVELLDAGCGNGRLFEYLKNQPVNYTGIDNNRTLISIAKQKNSSITMKHGDILKLPFQSERFDSVWCIAVIHHIPTKTLQLKALKELKRVTKKGGKLLFTAWDLWQPKYKKFIQKRTHFAMIPWGTKKLVQRFYYAFTNKEIKELLMKAGFKKIKRVKSKNNFAYVLENCAP